MAMPLGSTPRPLQSCCPAPNLRNRPMEKMTGLLAPACWACWAGRLRSFGAGAAGFEAALGVLPNGMAIEWTDLSFQEASQGNAALLVSRLGSACLPGAGGAL